MPTTLPGVAARARRRCSCTGRTARSSQFGEVATVFGKVGRADTAHRSGAATRWRRRRSASSRAPSGRSVARARWYSSWAPGAAASACCGWSGPSATPRTTAELVDELDDAARLPGLDERLDRAGARAHGHDGDRRAHAGRHPHRRAGPRRGWTRSARRCAAVVARVPGHAQRGVRVAGRRDLADVRRSMPRRCARHGVDAGARRAPSPICCHRRRRSASSSDRPSGAPAARPHRARARPTLRAARRPPISCATLTVRARAPRRRPGSRCRSALLGRAAYVRAAGDAAHRARRARARYVYVDLADGTDIAGLRRARARATSTRAVAAAAAPAAGRAHRVDRPVRAAGRRASGGCAGSCRWSRCRCWGCCSCSSAA